MTAEAYLHALALRLDPAWRRRPADQRRDDADRFCAAISDGDAAAEVRTVTFSSIGLEPGVDVLLWRQGATVDALERAAAAVLAAGLGTWMSVTHAFLGRTGASQYVRRPTEQEQRAFGEGLGRYLIVYPFTKSAEWYLLSREARQGVMNEHIRVGRGYPTVQQVLAYSFGLDSQDFLVAYDTDDLAAFGDLVRDLRGTESRRTTVSDTPILLGVRRPVDEIVRLLGASA